MGLPSKSPGHNQDPMQERAATLVQTARANAVVMVTSLLDRFPVLRDKEIKHIDFVFTVAGVFIAATRLNNLRIGDAREEQLMETVAECLADWDPDAMRGFDDCKVLFETEFDRLSAAGHEARFLASDAVGMWIVLNLLGRSPSSEEECLLVRAVGAMVTHSFFDWWQ